MVDMPHREQLAAFLRSRRERLAPVDAGLVAGPRRRTPGLRREEVAQLSGVSVTWYTWLEQARDITVSRQVLDSLSRRSSSRPSNTGICSAWPVRPLVVIMISHRSTRRCNDYSTH